MSIVSDTIIKTYTGLSATDYTNFGQYIHLGVEAFVKSLCGPIESTTYTNELYDGSDWYEIRLDKFPILSVKYAIIEAYDVIKVKNTLTDSSLATVVVDATNINLTVEGGSGNGNDTLAKATYTTMTLLVDAINAQSANGWSAALYDTDYSALKTSLLYDQQVDCTQEGGVAKDYEYLQIGEFAQNLSINKKLGIIYSNSGFPKGIQNISVTYIAGYATPSTECPDLYWWIMNTVKQLAAIKITNAENVSAYQTGDLSVTYGSLKEAGIDIPTQMFSNYKRVEI